LLRHVLIVDIALTVSVSDEENSPGMKLYEKLRGAGLMALLKNHWVYLFSPTRVMTFEKSVSIVLESCTTVIHAISTADEMEDGLLVQPPTVRVAVKVYIFFELGT
jgi:hypothetical protein